jgi:hypothetical protein
MSFSIPSSSFLPNAARMRSGVLSGTMSLRPSRRSVSSSFATRHRSVTDLVVHANPACRILSEPYYFWDWHNSNNKQSSPKRMWFSSSSIDDAKKEGNLDNDNDDDPGYEPNAVKHSLEDLNGDPETFTVEVVVNMPDMGEGNNNLIEKWYKQPGDVIKENDILCDITTPDFTFGMVTEDEFDAIMGEIHVAEGEVADDNAPICTIYHQEAPGTP